jgi:hypothetical protein
MERKTDGGKEGYIFKRTVGKMDNQTNVQTVAYMDRWTYKWIDGQKKGMMDLRTDTGGRTDGWMHRLTVRQMAR